MNVGDISSCNYAMMLYQYDKIDFEKKDERLVFIINILHASEMVVID